MTKEELAEKLNGMEYADTCRRNFLDEPIGSLVVVCGASDDLMQFYGAIRDELSCWNGGTARVTKDGLLVNKCDDENCPYFAKEKLKAQTIDAIWNDTDQPAWTYETDIPHVTFEVWDEGERYCRGIIFDLFDVVEK